MSEPTIKLRAASPNRYQLFSAEFSEVNRMVERLAALERERDALKAENAKYLAVLMQVDDFDPTLPFVREIVDAARAAPGSAEGP